MIDFLNLSEKERSEIFRITAMDIGVSDAIIEKDFWVVLMLDILFHHSRFGEHFGFKGGTSLSKVYNVIHRFSEDIDLVLDWRLLGYEKDEPWQQRSKTAQRKFNDQANQRAAEWIKDELVPELQLKSQRLGIADLDLRIAVDDPQTIEVFYPRFHEDQSILQVIRLEIGPLAAWTPCESQEVFSYTAEHFPQLFEQPSTIIPTVAVNRTFWEKATILHKEANRTNSRVPDRYSRHYYDLYEMSRTPIKDQAFSDLQLLQQVVSFKMKFYADNSANYEEVLAGNLKLVPDEKQVNLLRNDYQKMQRMMFGVFPDFTEILDGLKELEHQFQKLSSLE
ncbi:nucleotidyl transferase AbiEii/AbiGii toxin family protein [Enterococcus sp. 669A]|uniref:Nucleotidyl transferase AbiEii/AbiGii toxin family protein n=1 Tax=Candidatus Enterococcus moelleringii TaxID=2815325 RepID=A0ABS3L538_9ENTE|nr:nucleotidyl transferase AbiEii/AbiGii toxin family protein [Enterococcus sp. 669A]MBO1304724.1 nucleotidyl transferase AbiEii/AbiGii toxin family protein [Enterococcus sp. 669A]